MKNMTFKDLIAKFKALPVKTRNLIFVILGIAIFLCSYMLGYQKLQEKTAALNEEIGTQSAYVTELKGYYDNIQIAFLIILYLLKWVFLQNKLKALIYH